MSNSARKYILIPEYRPLYAMRECYGPTHGPLTAPCPTPVTTIRKLLMQRGDEALTILEVLKNQDGSTTPPVQLTLENYTLPYDEIRNGKSMPDSTIATPPTVDEGVSPVIVVSGDKADNTVSINVDDTSADTVPEMGNDSVTENQPIEDTNEIDPYAGMTKAERKAARRAAQIAGNIGDIATK